LPSNFSSYCKSFRYLFHSFFKPSYLPSFGVHGQTSSTSGPFYN
jgi:hypothetical protein